MIPSTYIGVDQNKWQPINIFNDSLVDKQETIQHVPFAIDAVYSNKKYKDYVYGSC